MRTFAELLKHDDTRLVTGILESLTTNVYSIRMNLDTVLLWISLPGMMDWLYIVDTMIVLSVWCDGSA